MYAAIATRPDITFDDRHSICGYVFMLNRAAISWSSNKQSVVVLSSTEAEYIGITHAAKEATWVRNFLSELCSPQILNYPLIAYCDNESARAREKRNVPLTYEIYRNSLPLYPRGVQRQNH